MYFLTVLFASLAFSMRNIIQLWSMGGFYLTRPLACPALLAIFFRFFCQSGLVNARITDGLGELTKEPFLLSTSLLIFIRDKKLMGAFVSENLFELVFVSVLVVIVPEGSAS